MANKEFEAIVKLHGQVDPSLKKSLNECNKRLSGFNKALIAGAGVAAAAFAGAGKYLLDLGNQFDEVSDTIRKGTGATGDALAALNDDFKEVYKSVPTDAGTAATAIADLNTRLDLSGETLQEVAKKAVQLSNDLGAGDISTVVEETSGAVRAFGVSNEDVADKMDYVFKVSQNTGAAYNDILKNMSDNAGSLQALNLGFDESAALMGKVDKAGGDSARVLAGLSKAQQYCTKNGLDTTDTMNEYIDKIKNATSDTGALSAATEIFGKKNAAEMVNMIKNGALDLGDFTEKIKANTETITTASTDTYDYAEKLKLMKQNLDVALEPIANSVFDALNQAMPTVQTILEKLQPLIERVGAYLPGLIENAVGFIENLASGALYVVDNWSSFSPIVYAIVGAFAAVKAVGMAQSLISTGKAIFSVITAMQALSIAKLKDKAETLILQAMYIKDAIVKGASTAATVAQTVATTAWNVCAGAAAAVTTALGAAFTFLTSPIGLVVLAIAAVVAAGVLLYKNWDKVKEFAVSLGDKIGAVFGNIRDGIVGSFTFVKDTVAGAFETLVGIIKTPINTIIGMVNGIIEKINSVGFTIPDWVPLIGGKSFSINIPEIPMLAHGGFTDGVSIAGEAGREAVISFNAADRARNVDLWEKAGDLLGVTAGETNYNGGVSIGSVQFSPQINVKGDAKPADILSEIKALGPELTDIIIDAISSRKAGAYE